MRRVVVTGLGLVTPLGADVETAWGNILAGKSGAGPITRFDASDQKCQIACEVKPAFCCLVPEKREELTTEGGLDVIGNLARISDAVAKLAAQGVETSLFIDADKAQIDAAVSSKATYIEIHTGHYADAVNEHEQQQELARITEGVKYASSQGLKVNAGHGLHYFNVKPIAAIEEIIELNIGHAIIARAAIDGMEKAVRDMKRLMLEARA